MAAGLGFKTFTTGEVLTAADTNGYLMQGILVFASAAARDAAITSPQEGQACYLKDTNQVLTYSGSAWVAVGGGSPLTTKGDVYGFSTVDARIPIGANNTVLTADSTQSLGLKWATPSAGSFTLISTTSLSGTSTTITVAANSYQRLVAVAEGLDAASNWNAYLQINSITTSVYHNAVLYNYGGAGGANGSSEIGLYLNFVGAQGLGASNNNYFVTTFLNPNDTSLKAVNHQSFYYYSIDNNYSTKFTNTFVEASAVISSIVYKADNAFSAGTVKLYGVN